MRVGINLLYLLPGIVGGTETYAAGLLQGFAANSSVDEFIIIVNREAADWPWPFSSNFTRVVCPVTGTNRAKRYYYEQIKLPGLLRQLQVDLVHSLGYVGPIKSSCPAVLSIPDLNYYDIAKTIPFYRRLPLRIISTQAARSATAIITISHFSKARLRKILKLPADKLTVTPLAPPCSDEVSLSSQRWHELSQRYSTSHPYIVAFGGGAVHKNITALLEAFALVSHHVPHNLVLIGHLPPNIDQATIKQYHNLRGRIIFTGWVPRDHIRPLLSHADLFVLPSLYEGFGLPILEAQQAGVAVACSEAGSLPEVAGEGAEFFDPNSVEIIAETLIRCLSDDDLRRKLRQRGRENQSKFSWDKTAQITLAVYKRALSGVKDNHSNASKEQG